MRKNRKYHLKSSGFPVVYLLAFLVPVTVMLTILAVKNIYPAGDRSFLTADMWHQYMPFFNEFYRKVKAGEDLYYSYNVGIGSNFLALYVYYLACPLNWLIVLVKEEHVMEFMTYLTVIKIGLVGSAAAVYLDRSPVLHEGEERSERTFDRGACFTLMFALFYALSGFLAAYNYNIMWLDCVYLFPVILLGLEKLVKEGRPFLYCIALGSCIYTNYYISIMICIFLVLYFIYLFLGEMGGANMKRRCTSILRFGGYSLLAAGLAGILLIPEVCAILQTDFGEIDFPDAWKTYFPVLQMLARHCMCITTHKGLEHWPNIYSGTAVMLLVPLYAADKRIPGRRRFSILALAGILLLGFNTNVLNFIWHGMNYPDSLPARQSFIYIFLVLIMGYEGVRRLQTEDRPRLIKGCLVAVAFLLFCEQFVESSDFPMGVEMLNILFVLGYGVVLYRFLGTEDKDRRALLMLALLIWTVAELGINTYDTSVSTTGRTAYLAQLEDYRALYRYADSEEQGLFRMEKFTRKTKNDGTLAGFPSASVFSSTMNSRVMDLFDRLGMRHSKVYYGYDGATAFTSALLNVSYMYGEDETYANELFEQVKGSGDIYLYKALFSLPFGYVAPTEYDLPEGYAFNGLALQNAMVKALNVRGDLFCKHVADKLDDDVLFTAESDGIYYALLTASGTSKVKILQDGEETASFNDLKKGCVLYLGMLEGGETITLTNGDKEDETPKISVDVYKMDTQVLAEAIGVLSENHMVSVSIDGDDFSGRLTLDKGGRLILSVPYEKGWTVTLNGEKREPQLFGGTFMAFDLEPGEYLIESHYVPQGCIAGLAASLASLLILIGCMGVYGKKHAGPAAAGA